MKKSVIFIAIFLVILAGVIIFLYTNNLSGKTTGKVISDSDIYSYTKAICNSTNFCQDYEIICNNNKIISKTPISEAVIQPEQNWSALRNKNIINKDCQES
mgnify:FL=1